jgi:Calcineurin-like phosphoesterase
MKRMLLAIAAICLIAACSPTLKETPPATNGNTELQTAQPEVEAAAPDYQWVQLGDGGATIIRAIFTKRGHCPSIDTTGKDGKKASVAMQARAQTMPDNFDITVCEAALSQADNLQSAVLAGRNLTLPNKSPKRVVVLGDTGCRIKGSDIQNCNNDPKYGDQWHFVKTAQDAARLKPDLVIHVGDYIYRESECGVPEKCGGSPIGDKWATWEADFFKPADDLLESAAWVFARGNHESCQREFRGWFLFLDPRPLTGTSFSQCAATSAPFNVTLDNLDLLVLDSSNEGDLNKYNRNAIENLKGSNPVWLVTHVPVYGISHYGNMKPSGDLQDAIKNSTVKFLVSGHIHFFEMLLFNDLPPQMISGGGATELDHPVSEKKFNDGLTELGAIGKDQNDPGKTASEIVDKFTFAYIDVESDKWKITVIDQDGTKEKATYAVMK